MNKFVKLLASTLAIFLSLQGFAASADALQQLPAPTDLKVNLLSDAYGVSTDSPTFSWVMNGGAGGNQSAYEIVVSSSLARSNSGDADVYDSGVVKSPESSSVKAEGLRLSQNSLYYWRVRLWNAQGTASAYSAPEALTTEVGAAWAGNTAIWGGTADYYSEWNNYTVELDMEITASASSVCFRKTGDGSYYMWQFSAGSNTLVPYICKNGAYTSLPAVNLGQKGVSISPYTYFHIKINLLGNSIFTYVNGVFVNEEDLQNYSYGTIGFRNGSGEAAVYRNVRVYKAADSGAAGSYLYWDQFAGGSNPFSGGAVTDGALVLGNAQNVALSAVTAYGEWNDFSLSCTLNVASGAAGVDFGVTDGGSTYYSWALDPASDTLEETLCKNGVAAQIASVDLPAKSIKLAAGQDIPVKITVQGTAATTFIGGIQADTATLAAQPAGTVGFSTGSGGAATFRDFRIDSSDANSKAGSFSDRFSSGIDDFSGGAVANSGLYLGSSQNVCLKPAPQYGDFTFMRDEFTVADTSKIAKAVVSAAASSAAETKQYIYSLYLNGSYVGSGPSLPLGNEIRYTTYDVTPLLKNGQNAIGTLNYAVSGKQFLLQMTVFYTDGTSQVLLNSGRDAQSWKAMDGTAAFGESGSVGTSFYTQAAENIDATLYPFGFSEAGFDDSGWKPVLSSGTIPSNSLLPSETGNIVADTGDAVSVTTAPDGGYVADLGREVIGGLSLTLNSPYACRITVLYGEQKNDDGSVRYHLLAGNTYKEQWTLRAGLQTISTFGLKSFRYVEILGAPAAIGTENVHSLSLRQRFDDSASSFTSSNSELNKIYEVSKYTVKETSQLLNVDAMVRERLPYQGDAYIDMLSNFAVNPDLTLSQYTAEYLNKNSTWPAEYKLMSVLLTYADYMYTGNPDIVREYYDQLKSSRLYDSYFDRTYGLVKSPSTAQGNPDSLLIDWPAGEQDGYDIQDAAYSTVLNAVACEAYQDMAAMANLLQKPGDAADYGGKAQRIKTAMATLLYDGSVGAFSDGLTAQGSRIPHYSQHASAFALACGAVDDSGIRRAAANYVGKDDCFKTSVYGAFFVLRGLYNADEGAAAMRLLTGTGIRSWSHMIDDLGATITAEDWDPTLKSNMTFSHPWGSSPAGMIVSGLFGIEPLTAGFSTFQIKFQPGGLESASVKVPTVKGPVTASFESGAAFSATVGIPCNTTAAVYVPAASASSSLTVDGAPASALRAGDYLLVQLGAGEHTLSVS